jgi:5'-nucleotidase
MRILLVNDDGFDEPGLKALEEALAGHETYTVAPLHHHSGAGMSLNLYSPIVVKNYGSNRFSVQGSPVDCVKLALAELLKNTPPDLVVSGINPGANVANNTWYSGTVAAATEASFWHIPAVAVSQEYTTHPNFTCSSGVIRKIVNEELFRMVEPGTVLNVNVPAEFLGEYRLTKVGSFANEIPFTADSNGTIYRYGPYEIQPVREQCGTDVHALREGHVSITPITSFRTLETGSHDLRSWCLHQS